MLQRNTLLAAAAACVLAAAPAVAQQPVEIQFWHAMGGALNDWVDDLAKGFNDSQKTYKVVAVNKGNYTEVMTGAIAAFRAGKAPHIIQVFEVGTATMMAAKGAVKPVYEVMAEAGITWDPKAYLPAVVGYYTTTDGKMLSMPLNSSSPIFYYNKDAFKKAGLPDKAPATWPEVRAAAKKLQAAGVPCGISTAWPSWVLLENFSAWHNLPFGTLENGFAGLGTEFQINSPAHVTHLERIAEMQKAKEFDYGGRRGDSQVKFTNAECGMYLQSSAGLSSILKTAKFDVGFGMMPYWPDLTKGPNGGPQNSILGGATLWVLGGKSKPEVKGVAEFFAYLSKPDVQAASHQRTGYLPITLAAYELTKKQGFYEKNPGFEIANQQMTLNPPTANSKGIRFGNLVQIRDIFEEEMEAVFAGKKTAKAALDTSVQRGNALLRQFERDNK
ncbi:MAG: sn-glycerol-3-phosphate ABC transporter substrate-binding protein UgpB [Alphaproteobacteria bacterium]|nr:sn-glycerol-3-phosphate ABC transporter substrate-binding protein UgpB [Alphaproteobacteria bacterium]